jgi:hypothetical protein
MRLFQLSTVLCSIPIPSGLLVRVKVALLFDLCLDLLAKILDLRQEGQERNEASERDP